MKWRIGDSWYRESVLRISRARVKIYSLLVVVVVVVVVVEFPVPCLIRGLHNVQKYDDGGVKMLIRMLISSHPPCIDYCEVGPTFLCSFHILDTSREMNTDVYSLHWTTGFVLCARQTDKSILGGIVRFSGNRCPLLLACIADVVARLLSSSMTLACCTGMD